MDLNIKNIDGFDSFKPILSYILAQLQVEYIYTDTDTERYKDANIHNNKHTQPPPLFPLFLSHSLFLRLSVFIYKYMCA